MVEPKSSSNSKRTSLKTSSSNYKNLCEYEVEEILGFKFDGSNSSFFVKWKGWKDSDNSWVTFENLVNSVVFRDYISGYFESLEKEILLESFLIKRKLKDRIDVALNQAKVMTMLEVLPFDPLELKVMQIFNQLMTPDDEFTKNLEELTFRSFFFKLDQIQQENIEEMLSKIHGEGDDNVTIENNEDFSFPVDFVYITSNLINSEDEISSSQEEEEATGCNCTGSCSKFTVCCPQKMKEKFPYKTDNKERTLLRLEKSKKIIECCELCKCQNNCSNRLTQQQKQVPLCLFMTKNRGWGLKASVNIAKGAFIMEFLGELIGEEETESRGKTTFMYDLSSGTKKFTTIDAEYYGNISRFINHSCEPNTRTWLVNDCRGHPKNQRLW
jgi:[histone H3]-lysine9 N-trimethyltransferase SUV39H